MPDRRVQSCAVVLTPAQGVDLSNVSGWDAATGTVTGYINVIVSCFSEKADSSADDTATEITGTPSGEYEENTELPTLGVTGTPAPSVTGTSDADGSDILVPADGSLDAKDDGEDSSDADATTENTIEDKKRILRLRIPKMEILKMILRKNLKMVKTRIWFPVMTQIQ